MPVNVGVPLMIPAGERLSPGGNDPLTRDHVAVDEVQSDTDRGTGVTTTSSAEVSSGLEVTEIGLTTVQVMVPLPAKPSASVAVTVATEVPPGAVGVPEITPEDDRLSPGGREPPVTAHEKPPTVEPESKAVSDIAPTDSPPVEDSDSGLTVTPSLATVQLTVPIPLDPDASVAVTVAE